MDPNPSYMTKDKLVKYCENKDLGSKKDLARLSKSELVMKLELQSVKQEKPAPIQQDPPPHSYWRG